MAYEIKTCSPCLTLKQGSSSRPNQVRRSFFPLVDWPDRQWWTVVLGVYRPNDVGPWYGPTAMPQHIGEARRQFR